MTKLWQTKSWRAPMQICCEGPLPPGRIDQTRQSRIAAFRLYLHTSLSCVNGTDRRERFGRNPHGSSCAVMSNGGALFPQPVERCRNALLLAERPFGAL